jgi:hypothetical protein
MSYFEFILSLCSDTNCTLPSNWVAIEDDDLIAIKHEHDDFAAIEDDDLVEIEHEHDDFVAIEDDDLIEINPFAGPGKL